MKRIISATAAALAVGISLHAQSAVDMLQVTQPDFRGTARFMGMGGAFTALGGDLSTLNQNPAGIGVYRRSEIGVTLGVDIHDSKAQGGTGNTKTRFSCNNFGYVGTANLSSDVMPVFAWGVTYNRSASFDRLTNTPYLQPTGTSLSNYIAAYTNGTESSVLGFGKDYNPYRDSDADWLSILAYNSMLINQQDGSTNMYYGQYQPNMTVGDAGLTVRERGYTDEYTINFGGNISNVVYWGLGIGITDMDYRRDAYYTESMSGAYSYTKTAGMINDADAGFDLSNYKHIDGSGWNLSFGLIFKPIQEIRIGAAIHSPTYWSLNYEYDATVNANYFDPQAEKGPDNPTVVEEYTDFASRDWKLRSPWRFMAGVSAVLGSNAIISVDYERVAYNDMTLKYAHYDGYGYLTDYVDAPEITQDVHKYCQASNILRVGAEYRVTPKFSIRAGYNLTTSNIKDDVRNGGTEIITYGTDPSFSLSKTNQNICFGLGYRFGAFSIDGAYVYNMRKSNLFAYTDFNDGTFSSGESPKWEVTDHTSSIVLSMAYRF